jgi:carboxyl-terminal processing protease
MARYVLRRPAGFLAIAAVAILAAINVAAQVPADKPATPATSIKPGPIDKATSQLVALLLEQGHLAKPSIDDELSKKWFTNYFELLDPLKYYFVKDDLKEFEPQATELDDQIQKGDLTVAQRIFERFLQRSDERLADAMEVLKTKPDFTVDEAVVDDPKRLDWPADRAEARDRLRRLLKLELLQRKVGGEDMEKAALQLGVRYKDRNRYFHQFDATDLLEVYLTAMTTAVDPHTSYMGPKTYEDFYGQGLLLSLEGIGASLLVEDGYPTVKEIVSGGAAEKDGRLQVEDRIVGILSEDDKRDDFIEKKLSDVVRKIRGPKGTKVRLIVQPAGSKEEKIYELTRAKIELVDDRAKARVLEVKTDLRETPIKLGIIRLPGFYGDARAVLQGDQNAVSATLDVKRFLGDFKHQKVEAVLLDLRGNGGGLLEEARTLSGLFIDQGPVVQVRKPNGREHLDDDDEGTAWDGPLAVLIDKTSASASEIFAGVVKDYGRGLVIGDSSTYGKGTVQQIFPLNDQIGRGSRLPNLGAIKLTVHQFYRPNGESTQIRGVAPDVHIPSPRDHADVGEGKNAAALKFDKVAALAHDLYQRAPEGLVKQLAERSEARRKDDPKFQEDAKFIERLIERKARHQISLNEEKFRAESRRDEFDEEQEASKTKKKGRHGHPEAWDADDYYNQEVARILADYVVLGKQVLVAAPTRVPNAGEDLPAQRP